MDANAAESSAGTQVTADATAQDEDQVVNPWEVKATSRIDYDRLVTHFGVQRITPAQIERIARVTGKPCHPWLRRGIFFAHQDLDFFLDLHEQGKPFYVYTGRGPSSEAMHIGHLVPFQFTKWLQDAFGCLVVIQMSDDEKCYFKDLPPELAARYTIENSKDIIACGFDPARTFIFSNMDYAGMNKRVLVRLRADTTFNTVRGLFGFDGSHNLGQVGWCCEQEAPAFSEYFPKLFDRRDVPCLVPLAIDQCPFFRSARDRPKASNGWVKPGVIAAKFLPALEGESGKMSASGDSPTLYLTDTAEEIRRKVLRFAFSGGGATLDEHRRNGADLSVDVPYHYLRFFEDDDAELARVAAEYGAGRMTTAEIKTILIGKLVAVVSAHQRARAAVTDSVLAAFFSDEGKRV